MEKILCVKCGVAILQRTAERNGGMCMPCKNGIREQLEASKASRLAEEQDPLTALWRSLVARVNDESIGHGSLSRPERLFFAVNLLVGEVFNGGFDQYFWNSSSNYCADAEAGLIALDAAESNRLLDAAKSVLFPRGHVPTDTAERREELRKLPDYHSDTPPHQAKLEVLDAKFWQDSDRLSERLAVFAAAHSLASPSNH